MKFIPFSIIHLIGFLLTICLSIVFFSKTVVTGVDSNLNKIIALFSFKHTNEITCQVEAISQLPKFTKDTVVNYSCDKKKCTITVVNNSDQQFIKSFDAIDNDGISVIDIDNFFFDTDRKIISYTTKSHLSSRIVVNFEGELLQSIDETPGKNRTLTFLGYQPQTGMLCYRDEVSKLYYFYSVDSVYFARRACR